MNCHTSLPWQDGLIIAVVVVAALAALAMLLRQLVSFLTEVWRGK